jgi:hypothetical protein
VLEVLYFSDRHVKRKLFERVGGAKGLLLVTATRHSKLMKEVAEREPFASLEREHGGLLHQVIVADEGTVEGMWRDPVGDLADALYPEDRPGGYAAASGYVLFEDGEVVAVVKKHGSVRDDGWFLREELARLDARIPRPDPRRRPERRKRAPRTVPAEHAEDPWRMLGVEPGTPLADARRSFRALIAQYHPDKVAHLAPEFRELAEERTRQLIAAWEQIAAGEGGVT